MSDQVVLITGALTGIGRAAAVIFAQQGAKVVVSGRRDKEGQELVAELRALGGEAEFVRTDVRVEEDVRNLVDETVKRAQIEEQLRKVGVAHAEIHEMGPSLEDVFVELSNKHAAERQKAA